MQKEKKIEIKIQGIIERNKIQGKIDWNKTQGKQFHQKQQENKAYRTVPLENYRIWFNCLKKKIDFESEVIKPRLQRQDNK